MRKQLAASRLSRLSAGLTTWQAGMVNTSLEDLNLILYRTISGEISWDAVEAQQESRAFRKCNASCLPDSEGMRDVR